MSGEATVGGVHAPEPGSIVGSWEVLECLDFGSYGIVYRARRAGYPEAEPVALKISRRPKDERFESEVVLLRRQQHPSVPRFEDAGEWTSPSGQRYPYLVMEWVEGLLLYEWMQEQPRTSRQVLRVVAQIASALAAAHADGNLHRDVKGDNIRVQEDGRAVLLDWGSGWFTGARQLTDLVAPGTRAYRPPEQRAFMWDFREASEARWESVPADDLYSLGVTLYRAVTGRYLPPCTNGGEPVKRAAIVRPRDMATVCLELEALILRLVSDDPKARGTAEQLARETQVLADTAGPEADKPILPTVHAMPTEKELPASEASSDSEDRSDSADSGSRSDTPTHRKRRSRISTFLVGLSLANTAVLAGLLVVTLLGLRRPTSPEPEPKPGPTPEPVAEEWHPPHIEAPDAGVGDETLLSAVQAPRSPSLPYMVTLPMPKVAFPGQKKPPCASRSERELLGACWIVLIIQPPCEREGYEYGGECLKASFEPPRLPTSEEP